MKKDILLDWGYEDLYNRALGRFDDAISGIITDGMEEGIAYDISKIPVDEIELIPDGDYAVEFTDEEHALASLDGCILFGANGVNQYKGAIVGTTHGHLLYDFDLIAEAMIRDCDGLSYEDAVEDIEYNTIRAMPYYPTGPRIIMNREIFE